MRAIYGTRLEVGVAAYGDEPQHLTVMLSLPFRGDEMLAPGMSEEETNRLTSAELRMLGETTFLEPEELEEFIERHTVRGDMLGSQRRRRRATVEAQHATVPQ